MQKSMLRTDSPASQLHENSNAPPIPEAAKRSLDFMRVTDSEPIK
jgi:hypothetical protein